MKNRFIKNGELLDEDILKAIHDAYENYSDGAIIEARDTLVEIVNAIDKWSKEN